MNSAEEVANLLTLAEKAGYMGEVIQYLTELEQIYQEVARGTLSPGVLDKKLAKAEELQGLIKDSTGKINYEPKVDYSGGKKSAKPAGKEATDAYLVGRCADYILRGRADCLNVFIHADKEKRAERIAFLLRLTDSTA